MHLREVCGISASCFKLVFLLVQENDGTSNLETAIVLSDMDGFTVVQEDIASQLGNSSQTFTNDCIHLRTYFCHRVNA